MTPFQFGQRLRVKLAAGPNEPTWGQFGHEFVQTFNPWNGRPKGTGMGSYMDKWYNPWTQNKDPMSRGETGLMRAGQVALGTGAAAGALAGGIAAAPTVAGMVGGAGTGTTAATAGTGAVAVSQSPTGQNLIQRLPQMANTAMNTANQAVNAYQTRVEPMLNRLGYSPDAAASDAYAVATGNFDKVKGPGWGAFGVKTPSLPAGAPSLPKPTELARQAYNAISPAAPATPALPSPMLGRANTGVKPPATPPVNTLAKAGM